MPHRKVQDGLCDPRSGEDKGKLCVFAERHATLRSCGLEESLAVHNRGYELRGYLGSKS